MKKYVAEKVGEEYVVPYYGVYEDLNEINWEELPEDFVVKSTAGWGNKQVSIVKNKTYYNKDMFIANLANWLYPWNTYYYSNMCITDEKIKPRVLFEKLLGDGKSALVDYKIYCANGEPKFALIVSGRESGAQRRVFIDVKTEEILPFRRRGVHKASNVEKPENWDKMLELAKKLSEDVPFVRVDFYNVDGKLYVGELTFSPGLFLKIEPVSWDFKLGEYIDIEQLVNENK